MTDKRARPRKSGESLKVGDIIHNGPIDMGKVEAFRHQERGAVGKTRHLWTWDSPPEAMACLLCTGDQCMYNGEKKQASLKGRKSLNTQPPSMFVQTERNRVG